MIIDLSENNTVLNWDEVKENVEGVILRCAYRGYKYPTIKADKKFIEYASACVEKGIPLGIYFMSQAITEEEAREEAEYTVAKAKEYNATLPLFIDSEWSNNKHTGRADSLSREDRTAITLAFMKRVGELGFIPGVYASESWYTEHLIYDALRQYYIWVADYGRNTGEIVSVISLPKYDLFQFTSNRRVPGIQNPIDCSVYPNELPNPEPHPERTITNMPILRKGSIGKAVKIWQIIVDAQPDGMFGDVTLQKTKQFQKDKKIEVDGVVGPISWNTGINSI